MSTLETLLELERTFWAAAGKPDHYKEAFIDEGTMAFDVGAMDKEAVLAAVEQSSAWASYTMDDARLTPISTDVAAVTYTTTARTVGSDSVYQAVISSVYVQRNGQWKLALHQQTPLRKVRRADER